MIEINQETYLTMFDKGGENVLKISKDTVTFYTKFFIYVKNVS